MNDESGAQIMGPFPLLNNTDGSPSAPNVVALKPNEVGFIPNEVVRNLLEPLRQELNVLRDTLKQARKQGFDPTKKDSGTRAPCEKCARLSAENARLSQIIVGMKEGRSRKQGVTPPADPGQPSGDKTSSWGLRQWASIEKIPWDTIRASPEAKRMLLCLLNAKGHPVTVDLMRMVLPEGKSLDEIWQELTLAVVQQVESKAYPRFHYKQRTFFVLDRVR